VPANNCLVADGDRFLRAVGLVPDQKTNAKELAL
jgi:hypothetical protein